MEKDWLGGLLLPVGLWLLLSAGTPSHLHHRLASAALIASAIATLAFVVFGFALAFGGGEPSLGIGAPPARWIFAGLSGFFLDGATNLEGLRAFVRFWPLSAAGAVLVARVLGQQARVLTLTVFTIVVTGVILPIVMCWMWGGGWLHTLGTHAGLGRGTVDLGHLAAIGIAVGAFGVVWLDSLPRREPALHESHLPAVHLPVRAVAGVLLVLASGPALAGAFAPEAPELPMGQFVSSSVAASIAILTAGGYTIFTMRRPDVLSVSRAAVAAVLATSSGGALLPMSVVAALGIICGLLATIGYYAVHERLRWQDDGAVVTSVFVPAAVGLLATGMFANGAFGVSGLLSHSAGLEAGQLLAQAIGLVAIALFAMGMSKTTLALMRRARIALLIPAESAYSPSPEPQPARSSVVVASAEFADAAQAMSLAYASVSEATDRASADQPAMAKDSAAIAETTPATGEGSARRWLTRFRRRNEAPPAPKQPRKVAYPYRVGGRPLSIRPPSASAKDAEDETSAASLGDRD
ncbi:MAG: hypothetical protein KatS3mg052_0463 [Candidatus Roseilinea sp.]|nr:MAG: hypothetical protein KatS3mg052_0463 [Candidatus Roseilinea sp.]